MKLRKSYFCYFTGVLDIYPPRKNLFRIFRDRYLLFSNYLNWYYFSSLHKFVRCEIHFLFLFGVEPLSGNVVHVSGFLTVVIIYIYIFGDCLAVLFPCVILSFYTFNTFPKSGFFFFIGYLYDFLTIRVMSSHFIFIFSITLP